MRRIYYLEINNVFDSKQKAESLDYLNSIIADLDNALFKDFTSRMSSIIGNKEPFYHTDDLLYVSRNTFIEYFEIAEISLPIWFPHKMFDDYRERMIIVWRNIYNTHRKCFKDNGDNTLYVYLDEICKFQRTSKEKQRLLNFLDDTCIKENTSILELYKDKFFLFIGYDEKTRFFMRIKSILRHNDHS